ncbi:uncharacterized protein LOC126655866 [Mercurialis annua]|uniref:uncharacterized protein LOC126655866 n=1 Tax=Mercurialis annua TaxID=3986 RepID=UPI00215F0753|nr:uncharacterized protein LOC126655866 [Mercurialis annua]
MKKVAQNIVFLFNDGDGFASSVADAFYPIPNSSRHQLEESFELSLDQYGIRDVKASGSLIHFIDNHGNYQVSVLLMEKHEPPVLVCAVATVLSMIEEVSLGIPTLIVPAAGLTSKFKWESKTPIADDGKVALHGVQIGPETDVTRAITARTQKAPSSLQIIYEPLACFLQLVRVLKLPTAVIFGRTGPSLSNKAADEELEILYEMGELLANVVFLNFLREKISWNPGNASKDTITKEPWKALYG